VIWRTIFQIVPVLAWLVSFLAVVSPLRLSRRRAFFATAALGLAFGKFAFFAVVGGNSFTPSLSQYVIWAYGWIYGAAMLLTMLSFFAAMFDGAARALRHPVPLLAKRIRCGFFALFAVAFSFWGIYEGVRIPSVNRVEIVCPGLPAAFDGYRIVHLSDLHCSTAARRGRFEKIVERVNALKPDLIAITGDFVDGTVANRRDDIAPLSGLVAKDGVLGCTGNHERYWEWDHWRVALKDMGIVFPEDSGVCVIRRGGDALAVGGLVDWSFGSYSNACFAFAGAPEGAFRILLFHRPYTQAIASAAGDVRLQLSGHTHGGAMPGLRMLVEYTNEGKSRGLYEFAPGRFLHLSAGTGQWAGFPLRFFVPAEISELVLRTVREDVEGISLRKAAP
jgi:hypothetical protein